MNISRTYEVAQIVLRDYDTHNIPGLMKTVAASLTASASHPEDPQQSKAFSEAVEKLRTALTSSTTWRITPSQANLLSEMRADELVGEVLLKRVEHVVATNQYTPADAVSQLQELQQRIDTLRGSFQTFIQSCDALSIYDVVPDVQGAEIGILLPRNLFDGTLEGLCKELREWDMHLRTFSELIEDEKASFQIRIVSTSDIQLFLDSTSAVAATIVFAVERLAKLYSTVLDIRLKRNELKKLKVPKPNLDPVEEYEKTIVEDEIKRIVTELMKSYTGKDRGRKNELTTKVKLSIHFIADRIDKGVNVEATSLIENDSDGQPEESEDGTKKRKDPKSDYEKIIHDNVDVLTHLKRVSDTVFRIEYQPEEQQTESPEAESGE